MDTLNNANIPFDMPNKTNNVDSLTAEEGMLLNFAEGLKKNDDLPNNDLIKMLEKSNSDRLSPSDFDKEDNLGPETNVDNPDDGPVMGSPNFDTLKRHSSEALNNNQNCNNPFNDIEKTLELNLNLKEGTFEGLTSPTQEECEPTVNSDVTMESEGFTEASSSSATPKRSGSKLSPLTIISEMAQLLEMFFERCQLFYSCLCVEIRKRYDFDNFILPKLQIFVPKNAVSSDIHQQFPSLAHLLQNMTRFYDSSEGQLIDEQWRLLPDYHFTADEEKK